MATMTRDKAAGGGLGPGLGFAVVSAASFGLAGPVGSGLMDAGWSPAAAVAVRVLVAAVVLLPLAVVRLRGRWRLLVRHAPLLLGFGVIAVAGCQLAYFNAVRYLPIGVALLIEYVSPLAVVGWLWLRRGERPSRLTVLVGAVTAVGLVLVLDVIGGGGGFSVVGVLWASLAMVGNAFYFVVAADDGRGVQGHDQDEIAAGGGSDDGLPGVVLAAGGMLVGGVALLVAGVVGALPFAAATRTVAFVGVDAPWWVCAAALGVVSAGIAYGTGIAATRRLGSRLGSFVALGEVVSALVFAWLLLGQVPGPVQVGGGLLVLAGVILVERGEPTAGPVPALAPDLAVAPDAGPGALSERPDGARTPR